MLKNLIANISARHVNYQLKDNKKYTLQKKK